ncbi:DUF3857 domain-containing protein [Polaribacter pectinis]|uniref:DUF3857 domain-containing protein n=1 Tax=Polaribacter pectinis TaxID=2738844 RepID=A0A7G9LC72_9FLAO|nr:DUF3857 domain-containing protein [Polaribacter pectinis]QNM86221.1 DUF3857 domain-containing protein [Polaribacter pectinis]
MKKINLLILLLFTTLIVAQKKKSSKMGQSTLEELKMTVYEKDSTASAVVLYEHANRYPDNNKREIPRTDYYFRIKIFNKAAFDKANIAINLYKEQKILDVSAVTYNLTEIGTIEKTKLQEKDIFTTKEGKNWTVKKFTLPNIKEGSVIEYKYSVSSPYLGIDDWEFQSDIPKIKSDYDASILGNYKYNIKIVGFLKLNKDKPSVDKKCVYIDGLGEGACAVYSYGMNNIPAFKEEDYMLSKKNYISKLTFDLKSSTGYDGSIKNYATTWKQADKTLKDQFFNNQTSKKNYFKRRIPETILTTENTLERAKKVFNFIRNHYTWNDKNWTNEDAKVKEAFDDKSGDVGEINLSLYNSLQAADIKANLVVLSTRNNGVTTKLFPVIYDYNYVIVKAIIDDKEYFLDATDKFLPFGQVPIKALNGEARIIDFKGKSSWVGLQPKIKSSKNITAKLSLSEDGEFSGNLIIRRSGYFAANQRKKISLTNENDYLQDFESKNPDLEVDEYKAVDTENLEKPLLEIFKIKLIMDEDLANKTRINPIFFDRVKENPFKLKERNYPVDFAYPRKQNYLLNLEIPEGYTITQLPESKAISLPNKAGSFIFKTIKKGNIVNVYLRLNISKRIFQVSEYYALKEFYKQIIISENSYIVIEKKP